MTTALPQHLLILGLGYTGTAIANLAASMGIRCTATQRNVRTVLPGADVLALDTDAPSAEILRALNEADALLCTLPPDENGDPAACVLQAHLTRAENLRWIGYLSSTGVYAERNGGVIDATHDADGTDETALRRLKAEEQWRTVANERHIDCATFRLAGIYGPGRSALDALANGTARNVDAPGVLFNRIHVDDIAQAVVASMQKPRRDAMYLLADNHPAEPSEVLKYAAKISERELPTPMQLDDPSMSEGLRRFYQSTKRIDASETWRELNIQPLYPSYREGLDALNLISQGAQES